MSIGGNDEIDAWFPPFLRYPPIKYRSPLSWNTQTSIFWFLFQVCVNTSSYLATKVKNFFFILSRNRRTPFPSIWMDVKVKRGKIRQFLNVSRKKTRSRSDCFQGKQLSIYRGIIQNPAAPHSIYIALKIYSIVYTLWTLCSCLGESIYRLIFSANMRECLLTNWAKKPPLTFMLKITSFSHKPPSVFPSTFIFLSRGCFTLDSVWFKFLFVGCFFSCGVHAQFVFSLYDLILRALGSCGDRGGSWLFIFERVGV